MPYAAALALAALLLLAAPAAPASAQGYTCEASALGVTLGTEPRTEPVTANKGQSECRDAAAGGNPPASPLPVTGSVLSATTDIEGTDPLTQVATASAGLGQLRIAGLPIPLERPDTSGLPGPTQIPGVATIDVRAAVEALVPATFDAELLNVRALRAEVTGRCLDGSPRLAGTSSVAGISVLGQELPTDRITSRTVNVVDTQNIDPSNLSPNELGLPGVTLDPAVQAFLDELPTISIPATALRLRVEPGRRIVGGGSLTQHALDVTLSLGGQNVVDLTIGEATVGSAQVNCGGVADLALECTARRLVLIDVFIRKRRVQLFGAASRRFAGRRVKIKFTHSGKTVARPRVGDDGLFRATAKLPRKKIRSTNKARYRAQIGRQRSFRLKLVRRMRLSSTRVSGDRVTITGRVVRPLAKPVRRIVVKRRLSCGRYQVVKRFKPRRSGHFRITVGGPQDTSEAAVYRMQTRVRKFRRNPKTYPTFTLPSYVDLAR